MGKYMKEFFRNVQTEIVDERLIGRAVLSRSFGYEPSRQTTITAILSKNDSARKAVAAQMHNNSPSQAGIVAVDRGVSAYYSWDKESGQLIVEWGEIDAKGEAKLHQFLNQSINFSDRVKDGLTVRSGHMAVANHNRTICLIDSLTNDTVVDPTRPEFDIVDILTSHRAIVIGSDGWPISVTYHKGGENF